MVSNVVNFGLRNSSGNIPNDEGDAGFERVENSEETIEFQLISTLGSDVDIAVLFISSLYVATVVSWAGSEI